MSDEKKKTEATPVEKNPEAEAVMRLRKELGWPPGRSRPWLQTAGQDTIKAIVDAPPGRVHAVVTACVDKASRGDESARK